MRRVLCATAAVLMLGCLGTARAGECVPFASGEILCEEGDAVLYFDPATEQWQDVTAELQLLQQLGLLAGLGTMEDEASEMQDEPAPAGGSGGHVFHGRGGGTATFTDDGCGIVSSGDMTFSTC